MKRKTVVMYFMLTSFFLMSLQLVASNSNEIATKKDFMRLFPDEKRTVLPGSNRKWPYKFVIYTIDESFDSNERDDIRSAMDEIEQHTCIDWFPADSPFSSDYVSIEKAEVCQSKEGRIGGKQVLSLVPACLQRGIFLHLLLLTLGIRHEHQRSDRDKYIVIKWDNIMDGQEYLFQKYAPGTENTLGLEYNYRSVMHYPSTMYAKNKSIPVISPKHCDVRAEDLGDGFKQGYLTKLDIKNINKYYECPQ